MITEEEKRQFLKNEEKLWDLAAITAASTLWIRYRDEAQAKEFPDCARKAYDLADALMAERRKRLKS